MLYASGMRRSCACSKRESTVWGCCSAWSAALPNPIVPPLSFQPCLTWLPVRLLARRLTALSLEASTYSELRASLEAAHNRSAELSQASVAAVH